MTDATSCLFITTGVVNPRQGGSGILNDLVIDVLRRRFRNLSVISVTDKEFRESRQDPELGGDVVQINSSIGQFEICQILASELALLDEPTITICLTLENSRLLRKTGRVPNLVILGDPKHELLRERSSLHRWPKKLAMLAKSAFLREVFWSELRRGVRFGTQYLTLLPALKDEALKRRIRITHIRWCAPLDPATGGSASGSSDLTLFLGDRFTTYSSIFERLYLRKLSEALFASISTVQLELVGFGWDALERNAYGRNLILTGSVGSLSEFSGKYLAAIFPCDYTTGVRTRILTLMALGVPTICHSSASRNIPELLDGVNCLFADSISDVVMALRSLRENHFLRESIVGHARETITKAYLPQHFQERFFLEMPPPTSDGQRA